MTIDAVFQVRGSPPTPLPLFHAFGGGALCPNEITEGPILQGNWPLFHPEAVYVVLIDRDLKVDVEAEQDDEGKVLPPGHESDERPQGTEPKTTSASHPADHWPLGQHQYHLSSPASSNFCERSSSH